MFEWGVQNTKLWAAPRDACTKVQAWQPAKFFGGFCHLKGYGIASILLTSYNMKGENSSGGLKKEESDRAKRGKDNKKPLRNSCKVLKKRKEAGKTVSPRKKYDILIRDYSLFRCSTKKLIDKTDRERKLVL
ncbi:hypothetical protein QUW08_01245 [Fournierella massiliensis]|uniref:Uncharacterized protein n=1 Tax=Allofournierella massiliensis TaxID=1650663 RepID=A0ABT7UM00_9FIRM|nr:hypothetical protein [Fournierella massiliensis]